MNLYAFAGDLEKKAFAMKELCNIIFRVANRTAFV